MDYTDRLMEEFVDKFEDLKDEILGQKEDNNSHLKGYVYDSLVYRFAFARYKAYLWEAHESRQAGHDYSERTTLLNTYKRDVMRFIEILNEAIGEHD